MKCGDDSCTKPPAEFRVYWGRVGPEGFPYDLSLLGDPGIAFLLGVGGAMTSEFRTSLAKPGGYAMSASELTGSLQYGTSIVSQPVEWNHPTVFPKFNPALGTLTMVTVKCDTHTSYAYRLENLTGEPKTINHRVISTITVYPPDNTVLIEGAASAGSTHEYEAYDGIVNFAGPSGFVQDPSVSGSNLVTVELPAGHPQFAQFIGTGDITLQVNGGNSYLSSGVGNQNSVARQTVSENVGADLEIDYTYTPFAGYLWIAYPVDSHWEPVNFNVPMAADLGGDTINGFGRKLVDDGTGKLFYIHRSRDQVTAGQVVNLQVGV